MKKIPTIFVRDFEKRPHLVVDEVTPGCEWVFEGEGDATRKWDGTCVLIRGGKMYARYDCKSGRTPPEGFEPCESGPDPNTGHWPGWIEVKDQPQYQWHREALEGRNEEALRDGTYELLGPKINGNPEGSKHHWLLKHGYPAPLYLMGNDRSFDALKKLLDSEKPIEGIVFHHADGRMAKIKRKDFGLPWPVKEERMSEELHRKAMKSSVSGDKLRLVDINEAIAQYAKAAKLEAKAFELALERNERWAIVLGLGAARLAHRGNAESLFRDIADSLRQSGRISRYEEEHLCEMETDWKSEL